MIRRINEKNLFLSKGFVEKIKEYFPLFEEVVSQIGYDISKKMQLMSALQKLKEVYSHDMSIGVNGFIYYSDTEAFFNEHRKEILDYYQKQAENLGMNFDLLCTSFRDSGELILDLLNEGALLKSALVWGYIENRVNTLYELEFFEFEEFFRKK